MMFRLFLLFLTVPVVEIYILVQLAHRLDWGAVLVIVVLTALLGAHLAKREGVMHLHRIQRSFSEGRDPAPQLLEGLMILLAAVLLITPGLLTDAFGFVLLVPLTRRPLRVVLQRWLKKHFVNQVFVHQAGAEPEEREVIDVTPGKSDGEG
jgi:UPF0716 protein FxsA